MNKVVFLLPLSAMFLLFYFGYLYINSDDPVSNKWLQNEIVIDIDAKQAGKEVHIKGKWDWTTMPVDGFVGDDYIAVTIQKEDGTMIPPESFVSSSLTLLKGETVLKKIEGQLLEDGIFFRFPNKLIEHESYGNRGEVELLFLVEEEDEMVGTLSYIHTWEEHEEIFEHTSADLERKVEESLANTNWVVKRFFTITDE